MANLRDLIVRGTAKFLDKILVKEVKVEGNIDVEGSLTVKGKPVIQDINIDISQEDSGEEGGETPTSNISIIGSSANISLQIPQTTTKDGAYMYVRYSPVQNPSSGEMTIVPNANTRYIGTYVGTKLNSFGQSNANNYVWVAYVEGQTDIHAIGTTSYLHIAYANKKNGSIVDFSKESESVLPGGAILLRYYIGTYVDNNSTGSTNPSKYSWTRFRGIDGKDGVTGTPISGTSYYFHMAYANKDDDSGDIIDFSNDISEGRTYTGTYVDDAVLDSDDPNDYSWKLLQGEGGISGRDKSTGTVYYMHIKYSSDGGFNFTGNNGEDPGPYIGVYVDTNSADSRVISRYSWSKEPNGILSITEYYGLSNSSSTRPTVWHNYPQDTTSINRYLWNYEVISYSNGKTVTTSERVIGMYGETGESISTVINYYLATSIDSGVTKNTAGWSTSIQSIDESRPYLWNYEEIKGDKGSTISTTVPCIIGTYGSSWYTGEVITGGDPEHVEHGQNGDEIVFTGIFPESGVSNARIGDQYLNTKTGEVYRCILAGNPNVAKWTYIGNVLKDTDQKLGAIDAGLGDVVKQITEITDKVESFVSTVSSTYVNKDDYNLYKEEQSSKFEQLSNQITMSFTTNSDRITSTEGRVDESITKINKFIKFSDTGIEIGDSNQTDPNNPSVTLLIDNKEGIQFKAGGEVLGIWDGNDFLTGNINVRVEERAKFGNFAFIPRSDGSLMLLNVGEE